MSFPIDRSVLRNIRALASDIDETITIDGTLYAENWKRITRLREAGVKVILVTGRTAGHALTLTTYADIDAAIGENGGVICRGETVQIADYFDQRRFERIVSVAERVKKHFAYLQWTDDNFMRKTDQTFYVHDVPVADIEKMRQMVAIDDLAIVYSSVHIHVSDPEVNKGRTLVPLLAEFGIDDMEQVITIGDSPNDVGLFNHDLFPHSVGVKNIENYLDRLPVRPTYILDKYEGHGFGRLCDEILAAKQ